MPKIRSPKAGSSSTSTGNEETRGLMTNASLTGNGSFSAASLPVALAARWQRIVAAVLLGCILLFVYESIEVNESNGDVALKLHKGHKQDGNSDSVLKPTGKRIVFFCVSFCLIFYQSTANKIIYLFLFFCFFRNSIGNANN